MDNKIAKNFIESLIFSAEEPLTKESMKKMLSYYGNFNLDLILRELKNDYQNRGIKLIELEKIISESMKCDIDIVKDEADFQNDIGGDTLTLVELVMDIEQHYDIEIPDEDVEKLLTVGQLREYIEEYS